MWLKGIGKGTKGIKSEQKKNIEQVREKNKASSLSLTFLVLDHPFWKFFWESKLFLLNCPEIIYRIKKLIDVRKGAQCAALDDEILGAKNIFVMKWLKDQEVWVSPALDAVDDEFFWKIELLPKEIYA